MIRFSTSILTMLVMALLPVAVTATTPQNLSGAYESPQSVGLVLSGGGAKGIAHIGVIQALEDNNIPIDYITGTSMGAIVGGLYACGFTPAEMMELIESRGFSYWSTGKIDRRLTYYFSQREPTPALANINLSAGGDSTVQSSILPSSIISPLPMNFAFMEIFAPYTAQCRGDFNRLFVPFRCIASDVTSKRKVVWGSGSVADAIRSSMNFPIVFHPIERDGQLLYDGGIYENYPIETMRRVFAPGVMIGVDVSSGNSKPGNDESIVDQLETMIIQRQSHHMPDSLGMSMRIDLERFGLLDFGQARAIYQVGYDYAMSKMDSIKTRVRSRIPAEARRMRREVFKSQTPALRFDSVTVTGGTPSQNRLLESLFRPAKGDSVITESQARDAYYRAITPDKLRNFVPQAIYNDSTGLFKLDLDATVKNNLSLGVGGYVSSSTTSMLYLSGAYRTLNFHSLDVSLSGWVGQSYMAGVIKGKVSLPGRIPTAFTASIVGSRHRFNQSDRLFFEDSQPAFVVSDELFGRIGYGTAIGRSAKAELAFGAGHLLDKYYSDLRTELDTRRRDHTVRNLLQIMATFERSTLDNQQNPVSGSFYKVTLTGVTGKYCFERNDPDRSASRETRTFAQAEFLTRNYWPLGKHFSLGMEWDVLVSTRHLLDDYYATIVDAPSFNPSPSSYSVFDPELRSYNFAGAGLVPVWRINDMFQVRGSVYGFAAFRPIKEGPGMTAVRGNWFSQPKMMGELAAVINLPFASISAYGRYVSTPAGKWNFGISFGTFILAPKFLR